MFTFKIWDAYLWHEYVPIRNWTVTINSVYIAGAVEKYLDQLELGLTLFTLDAIFFHSMLEFSAQLASQ